METIFQKKNVECGKEYTLYLSIFSSCKQVGSISSDKDEIELLHNDNKKYNQYDKLELNLGYNSLYIPLRINRILDNMPTFKVSCNNNILEFTIDVNIINIYNPHIIYGAQITIQNQIFGLINDRDTANSVFQILGNAGSGKSYLLDTIYNNSLNPFSSYVISFTGEERHDAICCFQIIILSKYGEIWSYINDDDIKNFNSTDAIILQQIKSSMLNYERIDQLISYFKNTKDIIGKRTTQIQILVDDVHKLSEKNTSLLKSFCNWLLEQQNNCKLFLFTRPQLDVTFPHTKRLTIDNIVPNDIEATIKENFTGATYLSELIKKYPMPLNVLHFINILCQIHDANFDFQKETELEQQILLNRIYENSNSLTCLSFGSQLMSNYKNNQIVYCVFKIETGISIDAVFDYFGQSRCEDVFDLCQKRILKECSNVLFPYHDILISAYSSICSKEMNSVLESFVRYAQKNDYVTKAKMFSVLIGIGRQCFWKYREEASLYRDELHDATDYYQALDIARMINRYNYKSLDDYDSEDCKNQFILANCIKYTRSYEESNVEFEKIKNIYELTHNSEICGIYLEAETEIVNNLIWMLDVKTAKNRLDNLSSIFKELYSHHQLNDHNEIYAFLNYYNRLMFVNYMLDNGGEEDYNAAVKYAKIFEKKEYEAFAAMDYAKSIYCYDLKLALTMMEKALLLLEGCNEKRRILDAKSEKSFINDIINKDISYSVYSQIESEMRKNHYIHSQTNIQLKVSLLKILFSKEKSSEIRKHLDSISINNSAVISGKRHQAFITHLYAATYYMENNLVLVRKLSLKCLKLMQFMGKSYQAVHEHNIKLTKYNGFTTLNDTSNLQVATTNKFIIDFRIW